MGRKRRTEQYIKGTQKRVKSQSKLDRKTDLDYISPDDYVTIDDLMYVKPYVFEFKANFKPRWTGKKVFEVFRDEFRHADEDYWESEFQNGRVLVNNVPVSKKTVWTDGMEVEHVVHRHESAVLSSKIHIAHDDVGYMVVSKPPSLPIHPCGTYRRNSLLFILKALYGTGKLSSVHRLDKETSGLVILAKDSENASKFCEEIKAHKVRKTYLAEVEGTFLKGHVVCEESILWDKREQRASVHPEGLEAETSFRFVKYKKDCNTSIVECMPKTGRTHQIRVHLTHLGYPIVNDPCYGGKSIISSNNEDKDWNKRKAISLSLKHERFRETDDVINYRRENTLSKWIQQHYQKTGRSLTLLEEGNQLGCTNCPQVVNVKNVEVKDMYIHLHALKYESSNWSFQVPHPIWADRDTPQSSVIEPDIRRLNCNII